MSAAGGKASQDDAEARWQQDGVPADGQVRVVALLGELVGGEMPDMLGWQGEQEDKRSGRPGLDGEGFVGQAAVQQLPALIVAEELGGFLACSTFAVLGDGSAVGFDTPGGLGVRDLGMR